MTTASASPSPAARRCFTSVCGPGRVADDALAASAKRAMLAHLRQHPPASLAALAGRFIKADDHAWNVLKHEHRSLVSDARFKVLNVYRRRYADLGKINFLDSPFAI